MRYLESPIQASYALSENMEGEVGTTFGFSLCAMPLLRSTPPGCSMD